MLMGAPILTLKCLNPFSNFGTFLLKSLYRNIIYHNFMKLVIKEGCLFNIQVLHWMNEKLVGQNSACKPFVHCLEYEKSRFNNVSGVLARFLHVPIITPFSLAIFLLLIVGGLLVVWLKTFLVSSIGALLF